MKLSDLFDPEKTNEKEKPLTFDELFKMLFLKEAS